jgi:hypothetical protein
MLDLCLSLLDGRSAIGRPVQMGENVFSLPLSNSSIPLCLFRKNELIYFYRTGFVTSQLMKLWYFYCNIFNFVSHIFLLLIHFLKNGITGGKLLQLSRGYL